jgi:mRNA-degrading endonuclease RelE of RelBE toxin-antitoxin system
LHSALNTGDLELAKKIHGHVPWEQLGEKDESVWHQTKPIKRLPGCFRIRIGRDYRLMVNWQGEEALRVLDCIHRSGLESWIHRRAGA